VRRKVERLFAPKPLFPPPTQLRDAAAAPDEPTNEPQRHRQARQLKNPCRSNSAPAAMTAINTSFSNVSGAILSRICCPTYMPSTTGNIAAVETETSSQLNWRLAVRRIASKPAETTRYSDASFVNAFPRSPLASINMKTSGPGLAAMPPRLPQQTPNVMRVGKTKRD